MTSFVRELDLLKEEKNIKSYGDLARAADVDKGALSRVRNGAKEISLTDVGKIAAALGPEPIIHARLLRAWLLDHARPPGGDLLDIEIRGGAKPAKPKDSEPEYFAKLPPRYQAAMRNIALHLGKDSQLRNTILWFGEDLYGEEKPTTRETKPNSSSGNSSLPKSYYDGVRKGRKNGGAAPGQK